MKGFKTVAPPQRYMNISQMHEAYGSRGIVAYSCKIVDSVLEGGIVIAVQNEGNSDSSDLKTYQRQLRKKHLDKNPIFYLRIERDEAHQRLILFYDGGGGEKRVIPKLEVKKSAAEEAVSRIPLDLLAQALSSKFKEE